MKDNIMIAMSGGVDSAVAAYLCRESGREAAGVTMRHIAGEQKEAQDAAALCESLGIAHYVAPMESVFESCVIRPFIAAYEAGLTPNPCVLCNKHVKFGSLLDFAFSKGFASIATGHYARIEHTAGGRTLIRCAKDPRKDQTYMLYTLTQDVLSHVEFPLGSLSKQEVRELALSLGLAAAQKADSQDICFVHSAVFCLAPHTRAFFGSS